MALYPVTGAGKDENGDITSLCGPWGKVSRATAIQSIGLGNQYYVELNNGSRVYVDVVRGVGGPYLRTNWDGTTRNNLDDLPSC